MTAFQARAGQRQKKNALFAKPLLRQLIDRALRGIEKQTLSARLDAGYQIEKIAAKNCRAIYFRMPNLAIVSKYKLGLTDLR